MDMRWRAMMKISEKRLLYRVPRRIIITQTALAYVNETTTIFF